jgi:deoxyribose-phosphate aldolase
MYQHFLHTNQINDCNCLVQRDLKNVYCNTVSVWNDDSQHLLNAKVFLCTCFLNAKDHNEDAYSVRIMKYASFVKNNQ